MAFLRFPFVCRGSRAGGLSPSGRFHRGFECLLLAAERDPAFLKALYGALVRTRTFDAKAIALQRTGRLGTYASSLGQEAVSVGTAAAMRL